MRGAIQTIRRAFAYVFFKMLPAEYIIKAYEDGLIQSNAKAMMLGEGSRLSKFAVIQNLQNNPRRIRTGNGTVIEGELLIFERGGEIAIGSYVYIGRGSRIWSGESVCIGDDVLISHNVNISDTSAHELDHEERSKRFRELVQTGRSEQRVPIKTNPIVIKDHAWINPNVILLQGITIGEGAIVAAGSVVVADVEPYTVVGGNPAKELRRLR